MVDIYADLINDGFVAFHQGTAPEELPAEFVTFFEDPSDDILHADNKPVQCRHEWTIIYYTKDITRIYSGLQAVINALKKRKYLINGQGYDVAGSWEGYDARAVDVVKIEDLEV